jgi:hypothetical protein
MATRDLGPSRLRINVGIDAMNNIKLRANAQEVLKMTRDARPENTIRNYRPKQLEFQGLIEHKK